MQDYEYMMMKILIDVTDIMYHALQHYLILTCYNCYRFYLKIQRLFRVRIVTFIVVTVTKVEHRLMEMIESRATLSDSNIYSVYTK